MLFYGLSISRRFTACVFILYIFHVKYDKNNNNDQFVSVSVLQTYHASKN